MNSLDSGTITQYQQSVTLPLTSCGYGGMLELRNSGYSAVCSVVEGQITDIEQYGIDEGEVLHDEQEDYAVVVPETRVPLSEVQIQQLSEAYEYIQESFQDENGIETYQIILNMIHAFLVNLGAVMP